MKGEVAGVLEGVWCEEEVSINALGVIPRKFNGSEDWRYAD